MSYQTWSDSYFPISEELIAKHTPHELNAFNLIAEEHDICASELGNLFYGDDNGDSIEYNWNGEENTNIDAVIEELSEAFTVLYDAFFVATNIKLDYMSTETFGDWVGGDTYEGFIMINYYVVNPAIESKLIKDIVKQTTVRGG